MRSGFKEKCFLDMFTNKWTPDINNTNFVKYSELLI